MKTATEQERCYRVWADIGEIVLALLTSVAALRFGKRLETLSRASFVPDSGSGNNAANAFLLGMTSDSFKHLAARRHIPKVMPGDESLYRFSDIVKTFEVDERRAANGRKAVPS